MALPAETVTATLQHRERPQTRAAWIIGAGVLLLACLLLGTHARAAEPCHRPQPHTLISWYNKTHPHKPLHYDPKNSAIYHPVSMLRTRTPSLYWIGLAWLAPESGALFALQCDGTPVDGIPTGAIGKLSAGPKLPRLGQTVMLVYVGRETHECVHDDIRIVALKDNKIISLWTHGYNQGINVAASGSKPRQFISENYTVKFENQGQTIRISGVRAAYPYLKNGNQASSPTATKSLLAETYHWDAQTLHYTPQGTYTPRPVCR